MRWLITLIAAPLLASVGLAEPKERQFSQAYVVFTTHRTAYQPCACGLDASGYLGCAHHKSNQMMEVSWKFLYTVRSGDVYRVSRRVRPQEAPPLSTKPVEMKKVLYSGKPVIVFSDSFIVTFQPALPDEA